MPFRSRYAHAVIAVALVSAIPPGIARAGGEPGGVTRAATAISAVAADGASLGTVAVGSRGSSVLVQRFTSTGAARTLLNAGSGVGKGVVVQPDGKVVVVGSGAPISGANQTADGFVKRFAADGSVDGAFGAGGTVRLASIAPNAVALGPGGTIVVAGSAPSPRDATTRVSLTRLTASGAPAATFGSRGSALIDLGKSSEARGVAVQPDGRIVVAGQQRPGTGQVINALIARITGSGKLDPTFGGGRPYIYRHPGGGASSTFPAVAIDGAGRILGAGIDIRDDGVQAVFVRLTATGVMDTSFADGGLLTTPSSRNYTGAEQVGPRALVLAGSDRIVAAGGFQDSGLRSSGLWVLTSSGRLDEAVGQGGRVTGEPGVNGGEARGLAVTPDGSLFAGGIARGPTGATAGYVQRYDGFGPPPGAPSAGAGGPGPGDGSRPIPGGRPGNRPFAKFGRVMLSERTLRPATRATLRFTLTAAATVSLRLQIRRAGHLDGGRCRSRSRRIPTSAPCTVFAALRGKRTVDAIKGVNRILVTRRFAGRTLPTGSYRFRLRAAGGAFRTIDFRVRTRDRRSPTPRPVSLLTRQPGSS